MAILPELHALASARPDDPAVLAGPVTVSYRELLGRIGAGAAALRDRGLRPGDRVAISPTNTTPTGNAATVDRLVWLLAADAAELTALVEEPRWREPERAHVHAQLRPAAVLTEPAPEPGPAPEPEAGAADEGLFYVGATSGSSAAPKLIIRTRRSWRRSFAPLDSGGGPDALALVPGSLASSMFAFSALHALRAGVPVRLLDQWSPDRALEYCAGATTVHLVPGMLAALADRWAADPAARAACTLRTILVCGAKLGEGLERRTRELLPGCELLEYYGSAEHSVVCLRAGGPNRTVGAPVHGVRLRITGEHGAELPPGTPGTVWVHSPMLCAGYLREGRIERDGFDAEGWLGNGDQGLIGPQGTLELHGRTGQAVINTGGHLVSAAEVEAVLREAPGVAEVVVLGYAHRRLGEVVCAVLEPRPGVTLDLHSLRAHAAARLSPAKRPRRWLTAGTLPRTTTAKVARSEVDRLVAALAGDRAVENLSPGTTVLEPVR